MPDRLISLLDYIRENLEPEYAWWNEYLQHNIGQDAEFNGFPYPGISEKFRVTYGNEMMIYLESLSIVHIVWTHMEDDPGPPLNMLIGQTYAKEAETVTVKPLSRQMLLKIIPDIFTID